MSHTPALLTTSSLPVIIANADEHAKHRFLEFFVLNIRNPNTRRAYARAATEFFDWCAVAAGVSSIIDVKTLHVATWIEGKTHQVSAPTVKLLISF